MVNYLVIFILSSVLMCVSSEISRGLPEYIRPCSRTHPKLNDCALRVAKSVSQRFAKGDTERGIPALEPLKLKKIEFHGGSGGSDGLKVMLKESNMTGVSNLVVKKINFDMKNKRVSVRLFGDLKLESWYETSGRLLIIPLSGNGKAVIKMRNCKIEYTINYDIIKKEDGNEYMNITKDEVKYDIGKAIFKLDNLFNGDKLLGETTERLINDLWRDVILELAPPVVDDLKKAVTKSIQTFLNTVTYDEFFLP